MHGHSHGGINEKADCLTNLGAVGEAIEGAANFFFGATVYNTFYELYTGSENEDVYGWPLYIGLALGTISLGAAYTHRRLDVYHQQVRHCDQHDEHKHDLELAIYKKEPLKEPLNPVKFETEHDEQKKLPPPRLTALQKVSLFGDASSHLLGRAGLLTSVVDGIAATTKNFLPPATRACVQLGSVVFGAITSASGIRTCWNTMLEQNHQKDVATQSAVIRRILGK